MSAGTGPSAAAEGTRRLTVFTGGKRTCIACQVTWVSDEDCWICGKPAEARPQIVYPHPYYYG